MVKVIGAFLSINQVRVGFGIRRNAANESGGVIDAVPSSILSVAALACSLTQSAWATRLVVLGRAI